MPEIIAPLRLRIIEAIEAAFAEITPANGYQLDLSGSGAVISGRLFTGDNDPLPCVTIVEPPLSIEQMRAQPDNPARVTEWDLLIQGWVPDDRKRPSDMAYVLAADVTRRLALEKKRPDARPIHNVGHNFFGFEQRITNIRIGSPVVRPPDRESPNAQFFLILTLQIVEDMANPLS